MVVSTAPRLARTHPLLSQFQFAVFRLVSEAREPHPVQNEDSLPWRLLCLPSAEWQNAVLALWRQSSFQELLAEPEFRVGPCLLCDIVPWICELLCLVEIWLRSSWITVPSHVALRNCRRTLVCSAQVSQTSFKTNLQTSFKGE